MRISDWSSDVCSSDLWISRGLQCQLINKQQKRPISWFLLKPVRSCLKETRWMPGSLEKPAAALLPMKEKLTKRIGKLPILIKQVGSLILNMMQEAGLYLKARLHQKIRTMTECKTTGKIGRAHV